MGEGVRRRARAARLAVRPGRRPPGPLPRRRDRRRAQRDPTGPDPLDGPGRVDRPLHPPALRRPFPDRARTRDDGLRRGKVAVVTGGAGGIGRGSSTRCSPGARTWSSPTWRPRPRRRGRRVRVARRRCAVCAPTSPTRSRSSRSPTTSTATEGRCDLLFANAGVTSGGGGLPWEQEINDWRWCFSVNVFGVAATVLTFLPQDARGRVRRARSSPRPRATAAWHRCPTPASTPRRRRRSAASSRPSPTSCAGRRAGHRARLLPRRAGSSTPGCGPRRATAPPSSSGSGPARPPRGRRSPSSRPSSRRPGCPTEVVDLDWLGAKVLDDLDDGALHPGPRRATGSGPCSTPRADAIARGDLPPTLLH